MKEKLLLTNQRVSSAVFQSCFRNLKQCSWCTFNLPTHIGRLYKAAWQLAMSSVLSQYCMPSCLSVVCYFRAPRNQTVREAETADERNTMFLALTIRVCTEVLQTGELKVGAGRARSPAVDGIWSSHGAKSNFLEIKVIVF